MHAYLIIGQEGNDLEAQISDIVKKQKAEKFEFTLAKINDVRELKRIVSLSLIKPTVIIIKNISDATTEALNAFLKSLEEPQDNLVYVLTSNSKQNILPTITSRCQLIYLKQKTNFDSAYAAYFQNSLSDNFKALEKIRKREDAINYLTALLNYCHYQLHNNENINLWASFATSVHLTLKNIKMNGNIGIHLNLLSISIANLRAIEI